MSGTPTKNPGLIKSFDQGENIEPHRFVRLSSGTVLKANGATANVLGISDEIGSHDNGRVDVVLTDSSYVEAAGVIAEGAAVTSNADGKAVAAAAGNKVAGYALSSAAADGDLITVLIDRGQLN